MYKKRYPKQDVSTTNLPIWNCAKESLGERMDEHHNDEGIFIKLLDFRIDVLLQKC